VVASNGTIVLEYLRALVWPIVALLAVVVFRHKLGTALDRIRELLLPGGTSVKLDPVQQQQQATTGATPEGLPEAATAASGGAETHANDTQMLTEQVNTLNWQLYYERIFSFIFGSQLDALRTLAAAPSGLQRQVLEPTFEEAKKSRGLAPVWTFEQWIGYLTSYVLVEIGVDGSYRITSNGQGLLKYIGDMGYAAAQRPY